MINPTFFEEYTLLYKRFNPGEYLKPIQHIRNPLCRGFPFRFIRIEDKLIKYFISSV